MQLILVSPILPGRTEACRRFVQEMCDGRGDAYAASRTALGIDEERIWIHETATAATVIVHVETAAPDAALHGLATSQHPFDCWFRQELLAVSGFDLAEAGYKLIPATETDQSHRHQTGEHPNEPTKVPIHRSSDRSAALDRPGSSIGQ